jgi:hypothetical protein
VLYPAMEDYQLDIMIGEGPAARSIKLDLPPFTLIGATTRAGSLTSPLRDRFGIVQRLEFYQVADLQHIVGRSASCLGLELSEEGAHQIARRSRGTSRRSKATAPSTVTLPTAHWTCLTSTPRALITWTVSCCWQLSTNLPAARLDWTTSRRRLAKSAKPLKTSLNPSSFSRDSFNAHRVGVWRPIMLTGILG